MQFSKRKYFLRVVSLYIRSCEAGPDEFTSCLCVYMFIKLVDDISHKNHISSFGNEDLASLGLYSYMAITRQKQGATGLPDGVCTFQFAHIPTTCFIHLSHLLDSSRDLNLLSLSDQGPRK